MLPLELVFRGAGHEVSLDGHIFGPKPPILSAGGKNLGFNNGRFLQFGKGNKDNQSNAGILSDVGWRSKMSYEEEALGKLFVTVIKRFDIETDEFAGCKEGLAGV